MSADTKEIIVNAVLVVLLAGMVLLVCICAGCASAPVKADPLAVITPKSKATTIRAPSEFAGQYWLESPEWTASMLPCEWPERTLYIFRATGLSGDLRVCWRYYPKLWAQRYVPDVRNTTNGLGAWMFCSGVEHATSSSGYDWLVYKGAACGQWGMFRLWDTGNTNYPAVRSLFKVELTHHD